MPVNRIGTRASWCSVACLGICAVAALAAPPRDFDRSMTFERVNTRIGSAAVSSQYRLTTEPSVVEQARLHVQMGAEAIKFQGLGPRYREAYPDLPELPAEKRGTITRLLRSLPEYQTVFALPIKFYVFYVYPMWMDGYSRIEAGYGKTSWARREYDEIYELTAIDQHATDVLQRLVGTPRARRQRRLRDIEAR